MLSRDPEKKYNLRIYITYFDAGANQRRKKRIHVLDGHDGPVTDTEDMLKVASSYCKGLFCFEYRPKIRLKTDFFSSGDENISLEENDMLGSAFLE
jgi:hypothetical protein